MNKRLVNLIFITVFGFPLSVWAQTPATCNVGFDPNASTYFAESLDEAKEAMESLCKAIQGDGISEDELHDTLLSFHLALRQDANAAMPAISEYLDIYLTPLFDVRGDVATGMIPNSKIDRPDELTVNSITLFKQGRGLRIDKDIPQVDAQACFDDNACWAAFHLYMGILADVYNPLRAEPIQLALTLLTLKDKEWTDYIKESRAQTPLGIGLTTVLYEAFYGKQEHDFKSPPKVQWFAMRPNLLYESVSTADDGDQVRGTIALEVIGFNYWQDACFGYACGASITVNYADRGGVQDEGYGLMFHFDNTYSIGVSQFGSESGVFFTIDLLELFKDKKASFDQYKDKYREMGN
ncbi:hypothetical protein [uncultured Alteromonas sp.]|uniref:hypothetical protein n=1 Tax=uncultured Alteromonas sp. TaxID=179113 RepID=UPI0030ECB0F7|tara:strand:+ start:9773 stop:10828 length:1056 start_codon:yes stop_codon:yes gene_type:complete